MFSVARRSPRRHRKKTVVRKWRKSWKIHNWVDIIYLSIFSLLSSLINLLVHFSEFTRTCFNPHGGTGAWISSICFPLVQLPSYTWGMYPYMHHFFIFFKCSSMYGLIQFIKSRKPVIWWAYYFFVDFCILSSDINLDNIPSTKDTPNGFICSVDSFSSCSPLVGHISCRRRCIARFPRVRICQLSFNGNINFTWISDIHSILINNMKLNIPPC